MFLADGDVVNFMNKKAKANFPLLIGLLASVQSLVAKSMLQSCLLDVFLCGTKLVEGLLWAAISLDSR